MSDELEKIELRIAQLCALRERLLAQRRAAAKEQEDAARLTLLHSKLIEEVEARLGRPLTTAEKASIYRAISST